MDLRPAQHWCFQPAAKKLGTRAKKAADAVKEAGTTATHRAGEAKQRASDKVKEEL